MGGKEALRGFLYQAFASVLEALCKKDWDKIYIEFDSKDDKIDIALGKNNSIVKVIQVKSTINTFNKSSIITWLDKLIKDDVGALEFELFLIGECDKNAHIFINALKNFGNNQSDKNTNALLRDFDIKLIENKKAVIKILPFDIDTLEKIVIASLHEYISCGNRTMTFEQIRFIAAATVTDHMISSTDPKGIDRDKFDEEMERRIYMVADEYFPKRITIGVKSFNRGAEQMKEEAQSILSFIDKFDGRFLKKEYDWNLDIYECLQKFMTANTNTKEAYELLLDSHMSIAFSAGRILDSKSGVNIFPIQKTSLNGKTLWNVKLSKNENYSDWEVIYEKVNEDELDSVLVLNVTRNIYSHVKQYIQEANLCIGKIINCNLSDYGATAISIKDGNHASILANSIFGTVSQRSTAERRAVLHIFASAPNAFMFFLGQNSRGFGKCILYEYDFEQNNACTYIPSIKFIN